MMGQKMIQDKICGSLVDMANSKAIVVDLHSHILPVDDGAKDFDDAIATLCDSYNQGVRYIFATPHCYAFKAKSDYIHKSFEKICKRVRKELPNMHLQLGSEVLCTCDDMDGILASLENGVLKTLGATKYVLAEFRPAETTKNIIYCIDTLINAGWHPVIAHVERYTGLFIGKNNLYKLHNKVKFQINAYSISEEKDEAIRSRAQWLLQEELADFLGSDTHGICHRPPMWKSAMVYIDKNCSNGYRERLRYKKAVETFGLDIDARKDYFKTALESGMYGLAIGDALGVPYEGNDLDDMINSPCTEMVGYRRHRKPIGTWSDDTSMALCVADSLSKGFVDVDDIAKKFLLWAKRGQYTATGNVFDIGTQTRSALYKYENGYPAEECGDSSVKGNGNGGLMRSFPISFYQCIKFPVEDADLQTFLRPIHNVSSITHGHARGLICCGLYSLVLREWLLFSNFDDTIMDVVQRAYEKGRIAYTQMGGLFARLIKDRKHFAMPEDIMNLKPDELPTWGYVLNSWNITLWSLLNTDNYRDCVLKAINLGGDTDTNAAIAGSLAGVIYGKENIPAEWIDVLQNRRLIDLMCERLNAGIFGARKEKNSIEAFQGKYAFLSMKAPATIKIGLYTYENTTAAYYALGVAEANRNEFKYLNNKEARKLYSILPHIDSSEEERLYTAVQARFTQNPTDAEKLKNTSEVPIIYDTTGSHDNVLGRCRCEQCKEIEHQNIYGKVLMKVREGLAAQES